MSCWNRLCVASLALMSAGCAVEPLCGADGVVHGGVSLRSDRDVEAMSGCTSITGDLSIGRMPAGAVGQPGEMPSDLAPLATLTRVDGNVLISSNPTLTSLTGLEGLTRIGKSLVVE